MAAVLEVTKLNLTIGGATILSDISFSLPQGSFLAIIGPNGAGKSSFLKCINRINPNWSGDVDVFGQNIQKLTQRELACLVGLVPQNLNVIWAYSVYDFVMMGRYAHLGFLPFVAQQDKIIIEEALDLTGTSQFAKRNINSLSSGERQKVLIATALVQQPRLLLLDEPTAYLDPKQQEEVEQLLVRLQKSGKTTMVLVTHDVNQAVLLADRVLALKQGRVIFDGASADLGSNLEQIYDKSFTFVKSPQGGADLVLSQLKR